MSFKFLYLRGLVYLGNLLIKFSKYKAIKYLTSIGCLSKTIFKDDRLISSDRLNKKDSRSPI